MPRGISIVPGTQRPMAARSATLRPIDASMSSAATRARLTASRGPRSSSVTILVCASGRPRSSTTPSLIFVPPTSKPRNSGRWAEATSIKVGSAGMIVEYRFERLRRQRGKSGASAYNQTRTKQRLVREGNVMAADIGEKNNMGRVLTEIRVENLNDLYAARTGLITPEKVRRVTIAGAVVDRGAPSLSCPATVI